MYDRPKYHREIPAQKEPAEAAALDCSDDKLLKRNEKIIKRRLAAPLWLGGTAIALSSLSFAFWADVESNRNLAAASQPSIKQISEASSDYSQNEATFYAAGFDTRNADVFAKRVGSEIQQIFGGSTESIDYNYAPLDPKEISQQIISYVDENELSNISIAGNSLGGIIAIETAEDIITNTDIPINSIILNATPDGSDGLLPGARRDLTSLVDILNIPGAEYSTAVRYLGTMIQESGRFTTSNLFKNLRNLWDTSNKTIEQISEQRRPGMWLLIDQALAITNADIKRSLESIAEQRGEKQMPTIIYLRAANPKDDTVVDIVMSSDNICGYAEEVGLKCKVIYVEDAPHTSYLFNTESYSEAIAKNLENIKKMNHDEQLEYALARYFKHLSDEQDE